jgi:hypothetical protein
MSHHLVPPHLNDVANDAFNRLSQSLPPTDFNLHLRTEIIFAGVEVLVDRRALKLPRDSYLVFADELPQANWGHPCRYLLYDAVSLKLYNEIPAQFPPENLKTSPANVAFHEPQIFPPEKTMWSLQPKSLVAFRPSTRKRYAILFAGKANLRHVNDLEFLYRTLRDVYDVPSDQIYVLNYDGTINCADISGPLRIWPGDGTPYTLQVRGAGTKTQFDSVIDELKQRLRPNDNLLLHTNGHGVETTTPAQ